MQERITQSQVVIRFAGDSGDGVQITGAQMTTASAILGNDVHTFPDFPAEIRAPAGSVAGVSGFQLCFASQRVYTPGDKLNTLVVFNPAALKVSIDLLMPGGLLLFDKDRFTDKDLHKAGYEKNPILDDKLANYRLVALPMTQLTLEAVKKFDILQSQAKKCKNMFALGVTYWLYARPLIQTKTWIATKFGANSEIGQANLAALNAGYNYAITAELFNECYEVASANPQPGNYRQLNGNAAFALGCVAASFKFKRKVLVSGYPITPSSSILQAAANYNQHGVITFQAEDEIASVCAAIGAAWGGSLAFNLYKWPWF